MTQFSRRRILGGLAALPLLAHPAFGRAPLQAADFDLLPGRIGDQTAQLVAAANAAAETGAPLFVPGGIYHITNAELPSFLLLQGVPGSTVFQLDTPGSLLNVTGQESVTLDGLVLDGDFGVPGGPAGLLNLVRSADIRVSNCIIRASRSNGIALAETQARIEDCDISGADQAGIFSLDGREVLISGNRVSDCGNGGILVWRSESGPDGTIVAGNHIRTIDWRDGGNGQNGNGINVYRADGVLVADNQISDCAFTAIRLNATNDTIVSGNMCRNSGEVAIFSEFAFSGSVIADNIVDGAAAGISMTNFDENGRLAVCSGNIVRNIFPRSAVNPDTVPYGIFAEADAVVSGNVVEAVPGLGIGAGFGPYLRDVHVSDNVVRDVDIGIAVSVADGAGAAQVVDNHISGARQHALAGMAWQDVVSDDLARDAAQFPHLSISGNTVG